MPFNCAACGRRSWPDPVPAVGGVLRCPHCLAEHPFNRPPLLIVTGTVGIGKSTLCARLAGTIPGAVLLDADIFASDLISVVPPNEDYQAFWRSMMRLAHELAQNNVTVVYFSTMLPSQALANTEFLGYFESVRFLCLTITPEQLHGRLVHRDGQRATTRVQVWADFNDRLLAAAAETPTATVLDAGRSFTEVADDARRWINAEIPRPR